MIRMELQEGKMRRLCRNVFTIPLYDALCKNQEGYNLICMINESGLKNNLEESMMSIINDMKEGYNYTSVMSIHFIRRITYEFLYNERSI